jgi:hypothetical protein
MDRPLSLFEFDIWRPVEVKTSHRDIACNGTIAPTASSRAKAALSAPPSHGRFDHECKAVYFEWQPDNAFKVLQRNFRVIRIIK